MMTKNDGWCDSSAPGARRDEAIGAMENVLDGVLSTARKAAKDGKDDKMTARGLRLLLEGDLAARGYAFRDLGAARFPSADHQSHMQFDAPEDGEQP